MTQSPDRPLAVEKRFLAEQSALLIQQGHGGKWVAVTGERLLGVFDSPQGAYAAGTVVHGRDVAFLIAQLGTDPSPPTGTGATGSS
jgi:hypothetical protein